MTTAAPALEPGGALPGWALAIFARQAQRAGGLAIGETKEAFLRARLAPRLAALGLPDLPAYARLIESAEGACERSHFIEALTTHTTRFFREALQYDWLRETGFPTLIAGGAGLGRGLHVWSAACSSGQELYSALMVAADLAERDGATLRLAGLGTDLSARILRIAETAVYPAEEVADIPLDTRRRHLLSERGGGGRVRIRPELRRRTRWEQANLADAATLPAQRADIAMLRNVLIYFDTPTRERVLRNVIDRIAPGGFLLTGHSETIEARAWGLDPVRPSIYRKASR